MGTRQTMKWDAKVHEDILICMFQHLQLSGDQWSKVMIDLRGLGYTFSDSALRQHVQKLRKVRDTSALGLNPSPDKGTKSTKSTPSRKRSTPKKIKPEPVGHGDDDDDEIPIKDEGLDYEYGDEYESPSAKRVKTKNEF